METKKAIIVSRTIFLTALALATFFYAQSAHAATLSFSPQSGTYFAGRSFSVSVLVSSPDQAMNAAQGEISFPSDQLEVLSISKANSIMTLWIQDPTFSNQEGTIDFGGVAVSPGFQGVDGTVLTIRFEAKDSGSAALSFLSGSVLANDGKGTNILASMGSANFTILPLLSVPVSTAPTSGNGPSGIIITSDPTIVPGAWYNINKITFDWNTPSDAEGVDYTISTNPNLQLPDVNQGSVSQATYDLSQLSDGVWYFFVSFNNGSAWSPPAVEKIMIDRTPPDPFVISRVDTTLTDTQPIFAWAANDEVSGIDHYEVKIGGGDWFQASTIQNGSSSYMLPPQSPTRMRTLTVRAFDRAGNYTDASLNFSVLAPPAFCNGSGLSCAVSIFFAQWGALLSIILILLLITLYIFLYYLLRWRRQSLKDLEEFKDELRKDLKRVEDDVRKVGATAPVDLRPSYFLEQKRLLEKELHRIAEEIKEELKRFKEDK